MTNHYLAPANLATRWQRFSLRLLEAFGWRINFAPLPGPHGVIIVYPHTSNRDFLIGLFAKWAIGVRFHWLGKESLFRGPVGMLIGPLLRRWGGEAIERSRSTGAINRLAHRMKRADFYWLALAPEGTRKYRNAWRSGFYHIALTACVPLGLACIDYGRKEVRMVQYTQLTGDLDTDLAGIRKAYENCRAARPDCAAPVSFGVAQRSDA